MNDYYSLTSIKENEIEEEVKNCLLELVKVKAEEKMQKEDEVI